MSRTRELLNQINESVSTIEKWLGKDFSKYRDIWDEVLYEVDRIYQIGDYGHRHDFRKKDVWLFLDNRKSKDFIEFLSWQVPEIGQKSYNDNYNIKLCDIVPELNREDYSGYNKIPGGEFVDNRDKISMPFKMQLFQIVVDVLAKYNIESKIEVSVI